MDHRFDPEFYTEFYRRFKGTPMPVERTSHYKLYKEVLKYLRPDEKFVDLGCGDGAFIELATKMGYSPVSGVEQCKEASELARKREIDVHILDYDVLDLEYRGIDCETFTCLELFEHMPNDTDLMLLFMLRESGKRIVFSVPDFDSVGHVRFFSISEQVEKRYSPDKVSEYRGLSKFKDNNVYMKYYICEIDRKVKE